MSVQVASLLRGNPWPGTPDVPYPRADPADIDRLPMDTWAMAQVPAGVRLELSLVGDVRAIEIDYTCATDDLGYRGEGAGITFAAWADEPLANVPASVGQHTATLRVPVEVDAVTVYLPEGMRPTIHAVRAIGGGVQAAPDRPRWICYGDSVAEGWVATEPARSWAMTAARLAGLDVSNLGYAGAARGEMVSAEHISRLHADIVSLNHGTNCWSRTPHHAQQVAADMSAFITMVRRGHPETPILVVSPILRPDAETTPNALGSTLSDLREAMESTVGSLIAAGDRRLHLLPGADLVSPDQLPDRVHPGDDAHRLMGEVIGAELAKLVLR